MSEIKKNIETCRGEDVLAEVSGLPQDPHFGSLVNEAFDPLKQQAMHQAGYDGYSEVIAQHKPYTFASAIIQMKSNLLLLLRALWQYPFGSGTLRSLSDDASLRSLSDMWQHYITRLQGSETYGIPSRLDQLTDLPSAPLLLADRKISGVPDAADGISLVHLLCDPASITELTDDNEGWILNKALSVRSYFPNCTKATIGCGEVNVYFDYNGGWILSSDCEYHFPNLKKITPTPSGVGYGHGLFNGNVLTHDIYCPELEEIAGGSFFGLIRMNRTTNMSTISVYLPKLRKVGSGSAIFSRYDDSTLGIVKLVLGKIETNNFQPYYVYGTPVSTPKLRHLEIGAGTAVNLNFQYWVPDSETLAHQDFLPNFRTYIALRLADNGSGKTLTLSQAVYDAIKDESHLFVFPEGTMTIYAYLTNIKHWTVTK